MNPAPDSSRTLWKKKRRSHSRTVKPARVTPQMYNARGKKKRACEILAPRAKNISSDITSRLINYHHARALSRIFAPASTVSLSQGCAHASRPDLSPLIFVFFFFNFFFCFSRAGYLPHITGEFAYFYFRVKGMHTPRLLSDR